MLTVMWVVGCSKRLMTYVNTRLLSIGLLSDSVSGVAR